MTRIFYIICFSVWIYGLRLVWLQSGFSDIFFFELFLGLFGIVVTFLFGRWFVYMISAFGGHVSGYEEEKEIKKDFSHSVEISKKHPFIFLIMLGIAGLFLILTIGYMIKLFIS